MRMENAGLLAADNHLFSGWISEAENAPAGILSGRKHNGNALRKLNLEAGMCMQVS